MTTTFRRNKMKLCWAGALTATLWLTGCTSYMDRHIEYQTVTPESFPVVTATGFAPVARQQAETEEERILLAMRASRLEAYRELAEQVQGIYLNGETRVADMIIQSDAFRTEVSGIIRGAQVVRSYPVGEYYATELKIDFERVHNLYVSTVRPQQVRRVIYY